MKRVTAMLLVLAMCVALTACGGNTKAFEESKAAYYYDLNYVFEDELFPTEPTEEPKETESAAPVF